MDSLYAVFTAPDIQTVFFHLHHSLQYNWDRLIIPHKQGLGQKMGNRQNRTISGIK